MTHMSLNKGFATENWFNETLLRSSHEYFRSLTQEMASAQHQVCVEIYILGTDETGRAMEEFLVRLAQRGVRVQLLVDGLGSRFWCWDGPRRLRAQGVEVAVYHPVPWPYGRMGTFRWTEAWAKVNTRDHKKCFIIDDRVAFVGSMNIHDETFSWRELGARIEGDGVQALKTHFLWVWSKSRRIKGEFQKVQNDELPSHPQVKVNATRRLRRFRYHELYRQIREARERVWIITPYFVPTPGLLRALGAAAARCHNVQIIVPAQSDHPILQWAARGFFRILLRTGVEVWVYQPRFNHAKLMIVDDRVTLGSTNFNHRSLVRDLELDIELGQEATRREAMELFALDRSHSVRMTSEDLKSFGWWGWLQSYLAYMLRSWL